MERFDPISLESQLNSLSREAQLAFGLSCCERMLPNYVAFANQSGWGDAAVLREALDVAWRSLEGLRVEPDSVAPLRQAVVDAEPNTEDFDTILVSSALDAASAIGLILDFLNDSRVTKIVQIASLCRDTLDMFVQEQDGLDPDDPDLEAQILGHRLIQAELRRQSDDLHVLRQSANSDQKFDELRKQWRSPAKSNIELSSERRT